VSQLVLVLVCVLVPLLCYTTVRVGVVIGCAACMIPVGDLHDSCATPVGFLHDTCAVCWCDAAIDCVRGRTPVGFLCRLRTNTNTIHGAERRAERV